MYLDKKINFICIGGGAQPPRRNTLLSLLSRTPTPPSKGTNFLHDDNNIAPSTPNFDEMFRSYTNGEYSMRMNILRDIRPLSVLAENDIRPLSVLSENDIRPLSVLAENDIRPLSVLAENDFRGSEHDDRGEDVEGEGSQICSSFLGRLILEEDEMVGDGKYLHIVDVEQDRSREKISRGFVCEEEPRDMKTHHCFTNMKTDDLIDDVIKINSAAGWEESFWPHHCRETMV